MIGQLQVLALLQLLIFKLLAANLSDVPQDIITLLQLAQSALLDQAAWMGKLRRLAQLDIIRLLLEVNIANQFLLDITTLRLQLQELLPVLGLILGQEPNPQAQQRLVSKAACVHTQQ